MDVSQRYQNRRASPTVDSGPMLTDDRQNGQVYVCRQCWGPDVMPPNQTDDQARRGPGHTQHGRTEGCFLFFREGKKCPWVIVAARQPDQSAGAGAHEQTDTHALENLTSPLRRDVHRRDLGAIDRLRTSGILELDEECLVRGFLHSADGLTQSQGGCGETHPASGHDRNCHLSDDRRDVGGKDGDGDNKSRDREASHDFLRGVGMSPSA